MPPEQSRHSVFPSHEEKGGESHVSKHQYRLTLCPQRVNIEDLLVRTCNTTHDQPSLRSFKTCTAMKAIQIKELVREVADLRVTTLPDLQPAPDKYLIQIHAAATNFFDVLQVQGKHQSKPPLPWIAGSEFSGEVQAVPTAKGHTKFKVGDQVFGATLGTFATQVLVDEVALRPKPAGWTYEQASGLFYTVPTAYAALVLRAKARAGTCCTQTLARPSCLAHLFANNTKVTRCRGVDLSF